MLKYQKASVSVDKYIYVFIKVKNIFLLYRTIKHVMRERGWFDQVLSPLRVINKGAFDHLQVTLWHGNSQLSVSVYIFSPSVLKQTDYQAQPLFTQEGSAEGFNLLIESLKLKQTVMTAKCDDNNVFTT